MSSLDFTQKSIVVITGASKGIGRSIAVELSRILNKNSLLILIARSLEGLQATKDLIGDKSIAVVIKSLDLSKPDLELFRQVFNEAFTSFDTSGVEFGVIFHNAGSTGELKQTTELTDVRLWQNHFDLNLFSAVSLNSVFLREVRPLSKRLAVVNITSLCGRQPFENLAMYGTSKAARELYFKVLALEHKTVIVLNYSPGPVDTEMFEGIIDNAQTESVRNTFRNLKMEGSVLTPEETVRKLLKTLETGAFTSGQTVDYYD